MLTASRSLSLHAESGQELPRVEDLFHLYQRGVRPRHGEVVMIAGRSGTQKSGFALWWMLQMALPTLYFSADMSPFTASTRVAGSALDKTTEQVEEEFAKDPGFFKETLRDIPITFSFGSPIRFERIDAELTAYIELHNAFPAIMVFDNLMDFDGAEADYTAQMEVIQQLTELARVTGSTVFILHHASDKTWEAKTDPWQPPSRDQIKNGLAEKPELSLTVALDPQTMDYHVACVKQRMGPSDPTARSYVTLRAEPDKTRFHRIGLGRPS